MALRVCLAPASVEVCHLLFSDPWPKRRHRERRVFNQEFLDGVARVLVPGGLLRVATDHAEYFGEMSQIWPGAAQFELCRRSENTSSFTTTFEERFQAKGAQIYRIVLRKRDREGD